MLNNISPSNLNRRAACPGSARMELGLKSASSPAAARGALLHRYMEDLVNGKAIDPGEWEPGIGKIKDDDVADLRWMAGEVANLVESYGDNPIVMSEHHPDTEWMGRPDREGFIKIDLVIVAADGLRGMIVDYKFGVGFVPAPRQNLQLKAYAVSLAEEFGLDSVTAVKLQPKAEEPWRRVEWAFNADALEEARTMIAEIVAACRKPDAPLFAGSHCGYCMAKETCPTRTAIARSLPKHRSIVDLMGSMTPQDRGEFMDRLAVAESWIKDAKEAIQKHAIEENIEIAGYEIGKGRASRSWANDNAALAMMRGIAIEQGKDPEQLIEVIVASPAKATKILGSGASVRERLEEMIVTEEGAPKLVKSKGAEIHVTAPIDTESAAPLLPAPAVEKAVEEIAVEPLPFEPDDLDEDKPSTRKDAIEAVRRLADHHGIKKMRMIFYLKTMRGVETIEQVGGVDEIVQFAEDLAEKIDQDNREAERQETVKRAAQSSATEQSGKRRRA